MKKSIFLFFAAILCAMSVQSANTMRIYCKNTQSWWKADNAAVGAYYWGTGGNANSWPGTRMTKVSGQTDLWYIDVDIDKYQNIIFTRVNGSGSVSDWGAKTNDLTIANTKNQYKITQSTGAWDGAKSAGAWETYKPTSTAALATSAANIFVGGQATLTSSLTSNASANTIKETAYAISPAGANVSGNTFTATAEGTYTITATVTYYPLGCPTLTSTATAETTIKAEVPAEETHDVTVSYMYGSTKIQDPSTVNAVGVETESEVTAPAKIKGYTFVNWTIGSGVTNTTGNNNSNIINILTKSTGDYTLTANYEPETVYFVNTDEWENVGAYAWTKVGSTETKNAAWPGVELTATGEKIGGYDVYSYTLGDGFENVIFTNINGTSAKNQTPDLKWVAGKYYVYNGQGNTDADDWYAKEDVEEALPDWLATNVFLAGTMNGWSTTENEFRKAAKGDANASIILNLTAETYTFKIVDNGSWLGNDGTIDQAIAGWTFEDSKGDCTLKATIAGDYTFTWAISTKKMSVTYPTICKVDATANDDAMGTIAGAGDYGKGSTATLTATPNDGYLFVNWTKDGVEVATTQEYSFKVTEAVELVANFEAAPEEVHNVTVSYMCGSTKVAEETVVSAVGVTTTQEVEAPEIWGYTFSSWTLGADVTSTDALTSNAININIKAGGSDFTLTANYTEISKVTIYIVNNKKWSKVNVYGWDGEVGESPAWPGQNITENKETEKIGEYDVYSYSVVPSSYKKLIINNKFGDTGEQSETYTWTDGKYYYIGAAENYAGGTAEEVEKALVGVFTIMGASELGLSWDLTKTGNDMTKQADGTYTLVKEGLDLATTGNYEYKVVKNHSWDWSIPTGTDNQTLKVDKDGTYTVTFTLSADKTKLTADAECTAEKEVILDCFVAGTTNLVGGTTDFTDKLPMTYDEGTKTYSKTFTALAAGNYQMKVVYGSDWLGYDKLTTPVPANVTEGDDKKIKFSLAVDGDVTVTYNVEKGIGLTGNFATPIPPVITYQLKGVGGWEQPGIELVQNPGNDKEYMLTCQAISATDAIKVVRLEDGVIKDYYGNGTVKDDVEVTVNYDGDGNITLPEGKYNFYFDTNASEKKLWIEAATDCGTEPETITINEGTNTLTDGVTADVQVNRAFTKDKLYTISLPFALDVEQVTEIFGTGTIIYEFAKVTKEVEVVKLYFQTVSAIAAATPYLIKPAQNVDGFEVEDVTICTTPNNISFTAGATTITMRPILSTEGSVQTNGTTEYWLAADTWLYNDKNTLLSLRALFNISTVSGMPPRCRVALGENAETGIDNITTGENTTIKVIENGQLVIIRNGEKFNTIGQKL